MSVVTSAARRRWATVAAGLVALVAVPTAVTAASGRLGAGGAEPAPRELVARALASERVGFSGLAESRGSLGLPDLPRFETVSAEFGGTTRTRVWWRGPHASRVDVLTPTGEQGVYATGAGTVFWDYERDTLTDVVGDQPIRLPRPDDLVPPQVARRLLAGVGPADRVTALPGSRRVAGVRAVGVRIVPGDRRSTIARLDVWLDPDDALPLRVDVVDAAGVTALSTTFTDLDLGRPAVATVRPPSAPGAVHESTTAVDFLLRFQRFNSVQLPESLAGFPADESIAGGTVIYGTGLTRFVVQPLPGRLTDNALETVRSGGGLDLGLPGGEARLVTAGAVSLVIVRADLLGDGARGGYLLAGPVTPDVVTQAARQLLKDPPR